MTATRPPRCLLLAALTAAFLSAALSPIEGYGAAASRLSIAMLPCSATGKPLKGPGYFVVTAVAGSTKHLHILVTNHESRAIKISLVPVDATHDIYGNLAYNLPEAPHRLVGRWVHPRVGRIHLGAGERKVVSLALSVPPRTRSGRYVGGLTAFSPVSSTGQDGQAVVRVQTRLAMAIVVNVRRPRLQR